MKNQVEGQVGETVLFGNCSRFALRSFRSGDALRVHLYDAEEVKIHDLSERKVMAAAKAGIPLAPCVGVYGSEEEAREAAKKM